MFNIEDSKAIDNGNKAQPDELSTPLILEGRKGQAQTEERGRYLFCCCKKKRRSKKRKRRRRREWKETIGGLRLLSMVTSIIMLAGALYLDDIIIASPNILMKNPNSPDTEDLLVPVEEFSVRKNEIQLEIPVAATTSSAGYLGYTVKYSTCKDYDSVCNKLLRDGKIWFWTCIIGIAIVVPGALLQATKSSRRTIMKLLSFLAMVDILLLLGVWWLEVYITLMSTKTASYPFYSNETKETTLIEMTFEDVVMYPSYSLALASLSGLTLCSDFALATCL